MQRIKKITLLIIILFISLLSTKVQADEKDITSEFVDENLRNSILELAKEATGDNDKTQIYESDIDKIVEKPGGTSLKLAGKGIQSLEGIQAFENKEITWIFLDWNEITDLEPLKNFSQLTKISFSGNEVEDLTPLANLPQLENILAINNQITTIDSIKDLSNIKYICLDGNKLSNIDVISNWNNLIEISFQNNKIEQLPDLTNLTELKTINLSNNQIQSIENIANINSLEKLEIDNNNLQTLEGIQNISNLKILSCSNNQITQISGIEQLSNLENINFNKNQIKEINEIYKNEQLKYLYLDNNQIIDFEVLKQLSNLQKYTTYNQNVSEEIKWETDEELIKMPLPSMYSQLYDKNSFLYNPNVKTEVIGTKNYKIDEENKNILILTEDLQKNDVMIKVSDQTNTLLNYSIILNKNTENEKYKLSNNIIKKINVETKKLEFDEKLDFAFQYTITRKEKQLQDEDIIATGDILTTTSGDKYTLSVTGDITEDGKVSLKDFVKLRKYILERNNLTEIEKIAADCNIDDKEIGLKDFVKMRTIILMKE